MVVVVVHICAALTIVIRLGGVDGRSDRHLAEGVGEHLAGRWAHRPHAVGRGVAHLVRLLWLLLLLVWVWVHRICAVGLLLVLLLLCMVLLLLLLPLLHLILLLLLVLHVL